ncbi:ABC transporter ATP-binding protein [Anaerosinus massiliensis]|uniref:ABC transporter ATP-binding protein n=1 Tax=Massilibacillus massiliensis TaxID=1806837 RepID=UPI000DA60E73|nr:ABC transporter ATP-binding protein [Massilibacillus massiliensis]
MYPYIKNYKKDIILALFFLFIEVVAEMAFPKFMAKVVGEGVNSGDIGYISQVGFTMIAVAVLSLLSGIGTVRYSARTGVGFAAELRRGVFDKVQTFSFANIDEFSVGSLTTRLTNDITQLQSTVVTGLRILARAPFMLIFSLVMSIQISPKLAIILAVIMPILVISLAYIIYLAVPLFKKMQKKLDGLNSNIQENLTNIRVVKSFVRETYEIEKFRMANRDLLEASIKAMHVVIINMPLMMFMMNAAIVAVVYFGGNMVLQGDLDVAEMTAFINYIFIVLMSLMMLSLMFIMLARASASYKRICEIFDTKVDLVDEQGAQDIANVCGEITFQDVNFRYAGSAEENVLENICFTVRPGEVIAIIGSTGAGKSSLMQLIPRLYDVTAGKILLDGKDIRQYTIPSLRKQIGMVLQKNTLFSGTIRDNLKWGYENASEMEIVAAAKAAQAHDFILGFANGYDTLLEQGGANLSGGQKQRLCIARAILKKPAILILDDSTSAVDTVTEKKIRQGLTNLLHRTTMFIIAQRISAVRDVDKILVMREGKIVASGSHQELLEKSVEYQEIYDSQNQQAEEGL